MVGLIDALGDILKLDADVQHFASLLIGPPGSGKTIISSQLIYERLLKGRKVIYITTDHSPSQILGAMKRFGWDIEKLSLTKKMKFLDLYSWQIDGNPNFGETELGHRACPLNTMDLKIELQRIYEEMGSGSCTVALDSVTSIANLLGEKEAGSYIQMLTVRIREWGHGTATLDSGVHSERFENYMHSIHDLVMEVKREPPDWRRYLRIARYEHGNCSPEWIPFTITDEGITVERSGGDGK